MIRSPLPAAAPKRHIVFTASLLSFSVIPGYAAYAPAKAAIRMLADTLREECILYDVDVHCSFPANILSPGLEQEEKTKPEITRKIEGVAGAETPIVVARMIISRLERGEKHITYQFVGHMLKVPPLGSGLTVEYDAGDDSKGSLLMGHVNRFHRRNYMAFRQIFLAEYDS
jgi:3-dehydrosphinganine reductase